MSTDVYKINKDGETRACSGLYTMGPAQCATKTLSAGSTDASSIMNSAQTSLSSIADVTASSTNGTDLQIDTTGSRGDSSFFEYVYVDSSASGGSSLIESDQTACAALPYYGKSSGLFSFTGFGGFNNGDLQYHKIYDNQNCAADTPVSQDVKRIDVVDIILPDGVTPVSCPLTFPCMIKDPVTPSNPDTAIASQGALNAFIDGFWGGGFTYNATTCNYERLVEITASTPTDLVQACDVICIIDNGAITPGDMDGKTSDFHAEKISDSSPIDATADHSLVLSITEDQGGNAVTPVEIMTVDWTGIPGSLTTTLDDAAFTVTFDGDFDSDCLNFGTFDGALSRVDLGYSWLAGDTSFTVCARVRTTDSGTDHIIGNYFAPDPKDAWFMRLQSGDFRCWARDVEGDIINVVHSGTLNDGEWHNVALVVDGTTMRAYLDSDVETNTNGSFSGDMTSARNVFVGRDYWGNNPFDGDIDWIRVYKSALSESDIDDVFLDTYGGSPFSEYLFTEGTGSIVADTGTGGNNGSATSLVWGKTTLLENFTLSHSGTEFSLSSDKTAVGGLLNDGDNWTPPTAVGAVTPYSANGNFGVGWTFTYSAINAGPSCTVPAVTQKACAKNHLDYFVQYTAMATIDAPSGDGSLSNQAYYKMYLVEVSTDPRFKTEDGTSYTRGRTSGWPAGATSPVGDTQVSHFLHSAVPSGAVPYTIDGGELGLLKHTSWFHEASPPYVVASIPHSIDLNKYTNGTSGVAYLYGYTEAGHFRDGQDLQTLNTTLVDIPHTEANKHRLAYSTPQFGLASTDSDFVAECCNYYPRRVSFNTSGVIGRWVDELPTGGTVRVIRGGTFGSPADVVAPITERVVGGTELYSSAVSPVLRGTVLDIIELANDAPMEIDYCPLGSKIQIEVVLEWLDPTDLVTTYETVHIGEVYPSGVE